MFAVIFEVEPKRERWEDYLATARELRPALERIEGFIENERFRDRARPARLLSLSTWRDEKALIRWRTLAQHHAAQQRGRSEIFADYHLRVGEVVADSTSPLPLPQQRLDETEIAAAKRVTITEATEEIAPPATEHVLFDSITTEGKRLLLASWTDAAAAARWRPAGAGLRHRVVRIIRDYGLRDRREAPQFYPPAGA